MKNMKYRQVTSDDQTFRVVTKEEQEPEDKFVYHFVFDLFKEMADRCKAYENFNKYYSYPYTFGERQLDSIFLPALSDLCNGKVLTEYPVKRILKHTNETEESSGRVDYLCVYKGRTFVIELKHDHDAFKLNQTSERTKGRWKVMVDYQLRSVKSQLHEMTSESSKGVIRLGLQFITLKSKCAPSKELLEYFQESKDDIIERLRSDLSSGSKKRDPDLVICWEIPSKMVMGCLDGTYPALIAFCKYQYKQL